MAQESRKLEEVRSCLDKCHLSVFCCRMNPRLCLLVSVHRDVGLLASKNERVGAIVSDPLAVLNAWLWSADHMKQFFVLRSR